MNASSPAFEFSFASSGITGTGTFWAFPFASAGLYSAAVEGPAGAGEADPDTVVAVVVEGVVSGVLGVDGPSQPDRNKTRSRPSVTCPRNVLEKANERSGMTGSPAAV
ncbi:hypothetical protein [Arthrobacter sp. fls2-241-R2A-200]|uniref:hypothetical protein n=1 Tax=Arthrobacter sp. fls2-241-R2A-200 TaxID=3040281 RepID=UPI00254F5F21|nr:hypothetical protein [Arthrobacter sp. fls2-241-R2A-200]